MQVDASAAPSSFASLPPQALASAVATAVMQWSVNGMPGAQGQAEPETPATQIRADPRSATYSVKLRMPVAMRDQLQQKLLGQGGALAIRMPDLLCAVPASLYDDNQPYHLLSLKSSFTALGAEKYMAEMLRGAAPQVAKHQSRLVWLGFSDGSSVSHIHHLADGQPTALPDWPAPYPIPTGLIALIHGTIFTPFRTRATPVPSIRLQRDPATPAPDGTVSALSITPVHRVFPFPPVHAVASPQPPAPDSVGAVGAASAGQPVSTMPPNPQRLPTASQRPNAQVAVSLTPAMPAGAAGSAATATATAQATGAGSPSGARGLGGPPMMAGGAAKRRCLDGAASPAAGGAVAMEEEEGAEADPGGQEDEPELQLMIRPDPHHLAPVVIHIHSSISTPDASALALQVINLAGHLAAFLQDTPLPGGGVYTPPARDRHRLSWVTRAPTGSPLVAPSMSQPCVLVCSEAGFVAHMDGTAWQEVWHDAMRGGFPAGHPLLAAPPHVCVPDDDLRSYGEEEEGSVEDE